MKQERASLCEEGAKRHSVAGASSEPIHMSLQEVRQYLQTFYSSSSDSSDPKEINNFKSRDPIFATNNNKYPVDVNLVLSPKSMKNVAVNKSKAKRTPFFINLKNKKIKDSCDNVSKQRISVEQNRECEQKKSMKSFSLKQALCSMFRFRRFMSPEHVKRGGKECYSGKCGYVNGLQDGDVHSTLTNRALPPLPSREGKLEVVEEPALDFTTSIHKVKDVSYR